MIGDRIDNDIEPANKLGMKTIWVKQGFSVYQIPMFLPCRNVEVEKRFQVKWLYDNEINSFYGNPLFPNAIAFPTPCPVRPDRIVSIAVDGENIMGMAGCSEDAPHWQQIGIDVLPEYRSKGIGSYLVTLLKNKIIEMGDIPFYGTATANVQFQNIAINSGFNLQNAAREACKQNGSEIVTRYLQQHYGVSSLEDLSTTDYVQAFDDLDLMASDLD